jgi:formate C-acetyltransferase
MSDIEVKSESSKKGPKFEVAKSHDLSKRSKWLRDFYFKGLDREWNNEYMPFTTGKEWDRMFYEGDYYIVPEMHAFMGDKSRGVFGSSLDLMAIPVELPDDFWDNSIPERRMLFFEEVLLNYIPQEIIGDADLIAGGRFNTQLSKCLNKDEEKEFNKRLLEVRHDIFEFHKYGFGNLGATGGHLIADYEMVVKKGFKFLHNKVKEAYEKLTNTEKDGEKGAELRAMLIATEIPKKLAEKYAEECKRLIKDTKDAQRKKELEQMAKNLIKVPWEPAENFWQGIQSVWLTHLLIIAEESYPGPGVSFGRFDQYIWDLYKKDVLDEKNITKDFAKDILGAFWFHCNTAYDAQIRVGGNQGITSGFGQLMTLSGMGPDGKDLTNELTYTILEVIDEWSPILEPKPNIRLHKNSPDKLLDIIIDIITRSQGSPFILNFDERSIAGLVKEGIPEDEAWDYACVGCLENTMQGNDRSGTVNCNPNLAKSIELTLWNGKSRFYEGKISKKQKQLGPKSGNAADFETWEEFWDAWKEQIKYIVKYTAELYNKSEKLRADFLPTPYLSTIVEGCIERGLDIRNGGPEIRFVTIEGVGYATCVDSLLAIKKYVFDDKKYTIDEIKDALENNFSGEDYAIMQSILANKAPKFGNDIDEADEIAKNVMKTWAEEALKYKTSTDFRFRGGMLSWNYWAGEDAAFTPATPNGRLAGTFLSNAICPTNGADEKGPTAVTNSVGIAMGGKDDEGNYVNFLPNGASQTITFNPSILIDPEHREKFKAYLIGYIENGGSALQINMIDSDMLRDAQEHPENYKNLLVRVTGYNAYFTAIGKELQDEIIARESHKM